MNKIRIGIVGYGNLGKSVEKGIAQNPDMECIGIFTRRNPAALQHPKAYALEEAFTKKQEIDVMILCGGSKQDIPKQGPMFAELFNTVDGFDTHAQIPNYFDVMNHKALQSKKISIISSGWDPGMFSLHRIYSEAILPEGETYTFWGKGISQGHSDAIRRIPGVLDARQYTIPIAEAIDRVRSGEMPALSTREKHLRECYVVTEEGADCSAIEAAIVTMPDYFADYNTIVHFISQEELIKNHGGLPHGGMVIRMGRTGQSGENLHSVEYHLSLDSNPDFTANVLLAYARAAFRMQKEGFFGAKTVADIAPVYLSRKTPEEIRKSMI